MPRAAAPLSFALSAVLLALAVYRGLAPPTASPQAHDLLLRVDGDGDGELSAAEYAQVSDGELPFALADLDQSGQIEVHEVDWLLQYTSPLRASLAPIPRVR